MGDVGGDIGDDVDDDGDGVDGNAVFGVLMTDVDLADAILAENRGGGGVKVELLSLVVVVVVGGVTGWLALFVRRFGVGESLWRRMVGLFVVVYKK